MNNLLPEVSAWYKDVVSGSLFEVVAYDEQSGTVEYQHVDGEVGEYDINTWEELSLIPAQAPEDWRTPYEMSDEDNSYSMILQIKSLIISTYGLWCTFIKVRFT